MKEVKEINKTEMKLAISLMADALGLQSREELRKILVDVHTVLTNMFETDEGTAIYCSCGLCTCDNILECGGCYGSASSEVELTEKEAAFASYLVDLSYILAEKEEAKFI